MPPYATAYSLKHGKVLPQDYYGQEILEEVVIYDPKNFEDWMERAPYEISSFFHQHETHLLLIKGFGLFAYDRDITEMAKKIAVLENSCRLLALSAAL
jgi:L-fuculose-phosphate aldolase